MLTGTSAPPGAFFGWASQPSTTPPSCGGTWTGHTGNTGAQPANVPAYMAVIVSSQATQAGATVAGDVRQLVVVRTTSYGSSADSSGTGSVVAVICDS